MAICDQKAAWVANAYESRNPRTTYTATLILVVLWVVGSEMRFVFYIFWKSKFEINENNDRPFEILTMIRKGYRAMYISVHLCSILVCFVVVCVMHACLQLIGLLLFVFPCLFVSVL